MRIFHKLPIIIVYGLLLAGCTKDKKQGFDSLPTLELVATHAFETDMKVAGLTFVPNDVAPWLGRVILKSDTGTLFSTDIEGTSPKSIGNNKYKDVYGLFRRGASGVFLAINEGGALEAFIEADIDGNFAPMTYSGAAITAKQFCHTPSPGQNTATVRTVNDQFITMSFKIVDNIIEQSIIETTDNGQCSSVDVLKFAIESANLYILGGYSLEINDGLSIRGLERSDFVTFTKENFGGAAFKDGVVAIGDANENRLVFISLDYLNRRIEAQ